MQVGRLQIFNNWSPAMVADPRQGLDRDGIFLLRHRPILEAIRRRR